MNTFIVYTDSDVTFASEASLVVACRGGLGREAPQYPDRWPRDLMLSACVGRRAKRA